MRHERIASAEHDLPRLCSVRRVAQEWDCGKSKVYKLIADGTLPIVEIDGMVRVRREDMEAYEASCARNSGSASTGANGSPSQDTARARKETGSALRLDRISKRKQGAKCTN